MLEMTSGGAKTPVLGMSFSEEKSIYRLLHGCLSEVGVQSRLDRYRPGLMIAESLTNAVHHELTGWASAQLFLDGVQHF